MADEVRKASDVLLALETQMQQLIALYRSQDLVLKVLSNKLNTLIETVNSLALGEDSPSEKLENTVYNPHKLKLSGDLSLPVEVTPTGFRRTSRPETFESSAAPPPQVQIRPGQNIPPQILPPPSKQLNMPVQIPDFPDFETATPQEKPVAVEAVSSRGVRVQQPNPPKPQPQQPQTPATPGNKIPIKQRLVDKNGKAIFLANIEIVNADTGAQEAKTRTNGVGKWEASLLPGNYQVKVTKQESLSKEKLDLTQSIKIDGLSVTQELPVLICK